MSKLSERRNQIREFTTGEAEQELERLRRQLFDLRIQQQRGEVKNNRQFTQVRTDIARLMYQLDLLAQAEEEEALEAEERALEEEVAEEQAGEAAAEEDEEAESEAEQEEPQAGEAASVVEEAGEEAPAEEEKE